MLRQALHDHQEAAAGAAGDENVRHRREGAVVSSSSSGYGSTDEHRIHDDEEEGQSTTVGEGSEEDEDDDDDELEDDDDDADNDESSAPPLPRYLRYWEAIKNGIRIVANVENLWDESATPDSSTSSARGGAGADRRENPSSTSVSDETRRLLGSSSIGGSSPHRDSSNRQRQQQQQPNYPFYFRTRNLIVLFWFVVLASSYAAERSTFKLLVDRAGPFRLLAVQMVTLVHAVMLLSSILLAKFVKDPTTASTGTQGRGGGPPTNGVSSPPSHMHEVKLGISIIDVALMALLESVQLILMFLTGVHVPPTLTVILIQFTLPLTAFLTQFVHPQGRFNCSPTSSSGSTAATSSAAADGTHGGSGEATPPPPPPGHPPPPPSDPYRSGDERDALLSTSYHHNRLATIVDADDNDSSYENSCGGLSSEHVYGSLIIFLAVALALVPAFVSIAQPDYFDYADTIPIRTAFNTLLYVSSCIPAAASQLYKEHVFLQYKQPVNMTYLNLLLSVFEFVFCAILSPLVFELQGLGARGTWTSLYPSSKFTENIWDGLKCFVRTLPDDDQANKYYDDARCDFALGLTVFHAFAIIAVGVAVDKIVNAGATKVMYRGMSAGIVLAVLCMHAYDMSIPEFSYGPVIDGLNLACLIILILGSEVYHRVALKDLTFDTVYQEVHLESLYDG